MFSPELLFRGARCCALSLVREGSDASTHKLVRVKGWRRRDIAVADITPHPAASPPPSPTRGEGTSYTGVKNGRGAPSVGLNTTFTFWPIFNVSMLQSTILVC